MNTPFVTTFPDNVITDSTGDTVAVVNPDHRNLIPLFTIAPEMIALLRRIDDENGRHYHLTPDASRALTLMLHGDGSTQPNLP